MFDNPIDHSLRRQFVQSRAQSQFRGETWQLSWEDFYYLWTRDQNYLLRGRGPNRLALCRRDPQGPWSLANCAIETRSEHLRRLYTGHRRSQTV